MSTAIDYQFLRSLPDNEKAKVAKILLGDARNRLGGGRLKLLKNDSAQNSCVDFWRVSSVDQRDGYSLSAQEDKASEYKKTLKLNSSKSWSVSESASKEFDRKKFFEMIDYVTDNGIKNVVFDKVDRACRGLRAAVMIEDLIDSGVRFHFVRDNLVVDKHSSPSEKLRFYLGVVLAKWYIDNLKTEIKKGLDIRLDEGYFNAKAPTGYINVRPDIGKANLEIHPTVGPFISECFELYKTGNYSRKDLEKIGLERGIKWQVKKRVHDDSGRSSMTMVDKHVSEKLLEKLLTNPTYCQYRRSGNSFIKVENAKWPAITSYETFMACQKIKGIRARKNQVNLSAKIAKPLMQLMTCGECGHMVTGQVKKKASGKVYVYYHCANSKCAQKKVYTEQKKLFKQFVAALEPFSRFTPKATKAFIEALKTHTKSLNMYSIERVAELRSSQFNLKHKMSEVEQLQKDGILSGEELEKIKSIRMEQIERSEVEIDAHMKVDRELLEVGLNIIELLKIPNDFMSLDGHELQKVRLLKSVLSNLTLKDGNVRYDYKKPFDDLLLLTGGRNWWRRRHLNDS